jgi:hypothetical protein
LSFIREPISARRVIRASKSMRCFFLYIMK